jgi:hypothetical protein
LDALHSKQNITNALAIVSRKKYQEVLDRPGLQLLMTNREVPNPLITISLAIGMHLT